MPRAWVVNSVLENFKKLLVEDCGLGAASILHPLLNWINASRKQCLEHRPLMRLYIIFRLEG